jgi:hypothetical protein
MRCASASASRSASGSGRREQVCAQAEQVFAQRLQRCTLALAVGAAWALRAFALGLQLHIELAACGDELAFDVIASGGFA